MLKTILLDVLKAVIVPFVKMFSNPHKLVWYDLFILVSFIVLIIFIIYV